MGAKVPPPEAAAAFMAYSMALPYPDGMRNEYSVMKPTLFLAAALAGAVPATALAAHPPRDREQDEAFRGTQQGRFMPLRAIENRIVPHMRGFDYLGPELQSASARYRLKFMRGPQVVWIDVDARTGEIVARSGF
jgi:hypothetical protein